MSIFCIILAVFLVTVIFGMADMFIRSQLIQARKEDGNWHVAFRYISDEEAKMISVRPEVTASSWYGVLNYNGDQGYTLAGRKVIIGGSEESFLRKMQIDMIKSGKFPQNDNEAMVTENTERALNLQIGDKISIDTSDGTELQFTVSGFLTDVSKIMEEDSYAIFLTTSGYRSIYPGVTKGEPADYKSTFYVQFSNYCNIQKVIQNIKRSLGLTDKQVLENAKLLGLLGQSGNAFMLQIYGTALVLFMLVLLAGIMMIASSLNSNIAQRTEFFGMLRCIGTTPKQVMKLVRREALSWCKFAIPSGVAAGCVIIWILCAMLRYLSPDYFRSMPAFAISIPSIAAGICVGILTVLLAARSPARRASRVSPLAAVSGNANNLRPVRKAANTVFFKIDTALGIHHAKSSNKNFFLMVASFSLSIILFLSFSVTIDFMKHSLTPLKPWTPDLSIVSADNSCSLNGSLLNTLRSKQSVKRAYGRMFAYNVPATVNGRNRKIDLISYEENQFRWAKDYLLAGSIEEVQKEKDTGLIVFREKNSMQVGDTITLQAGGYSSDLKISGSLSSSPFQSDPGVGTIICSESTFRKLTGQTDYTIIDMQLYKNASEADIEQIHQLAGSKNMFSDRRQSNRSVRGSYYSFGLFIYGFMIMIAFITIFNIINSIAMSVSARLKQYGAFRAIGLSSRQLEKMIIAEASTYAFTGSVCGSILGLFLNKCLYEKMITFHWGKQWNVPYAELGIILAVVVVSIIYAVRGPVKRIRRMSIVDTISAQ
jgi:ABC-type transport system, involved in lipoprotein release, permease component